MKHFSTNLAARVNEIDNVDSHLSVVVIIYLFLLYILYLIAVVICCIVRHFDFDIRHTILDSHAARQRDIN